MKRWISAGVVVVLTSSPASAHFLWVVPQAASPTAHVIISETLEVDTRVDRAMVAEASLRWSGEDGRDSAVSLSPGEPAWTAPLLATRGVLQGHADLGLHSSDGRRYRLHYYPRAIVGDPFAVRAVSSPGPIEIVPVGSAGALRFKVLVAGKPQAGVDVSVIRPDGPETMVRTGADGTTDPLKATGRYGAWARYAEPISGTYKGQTFEETRHYATLVVDTASPAAAAGHSGAH